MSLATCNHLAIVIFWIGVAIASSVYALMLYSFAQFHRRAPDEAKNLARSSAELVWASVPIFIMVSAATPVIEPWLQRNQMCTTAFTADIANSPRQP